MLGHRRPMRRKGKRAQKKGEKMGLLGMILSVDTEGTILDINHVAWSLGDFYFLGPWGATSLFIKKQIGIQIISRIRCLAENIYIWIFII